MSLCDNIQWALVRHSKRCVCSLFWSLKIGPSCENAEAEFPCIHKCVVVFFFFKYPAPVLSMFYFDIKSQRQKYLVCVERPQIFTFADNYSKPSNGRKAYKWFATFCVGNSFVTRFQNKTQPAPLDSRQTPVSSARVFVLLNDTAS